MPALLEPHVACGPLARDEGSLTLVTWVQGASANWLLLRYLHCLLSSGPRTDDGGEDDVPGVVLVSFLRDARFWAEGCARLVSCFFLALFLPLHLSSRNKSCMRPEIARTTLQFTKETKG